MFSLQEPHILERNSSVEVAPAIDEAPCKRRRLGEHRPTYSSHDDHIHYVVHTIASSEQNVQVRSIEAYSNFVSLPTSNDYEQGHHLPEEGDEKQECCYGMISNTPLRLKLAKNGSGIHSKKLPVIFNSAGTLSSRENSSSHVFDIVCPTTLKILHDLQEIPEIYTQLYCHASFELSQTDSTNRNGQRRGRRRQSWFLNTILYGPNLLEETIGDYFDKQHVYLQDPLGCDRRVPYRNPHIIQPELGGTIMTDEIDSSIGNLEIERLEVGPDLLAQLMDDEIDHSETDAPPIIKTALFPHQKQALTFMLHREESWALEDSNRDIWTRHSAIAYRNNVTGSFQDQPPPPFRGGLLADDMGLGKTLSMICLIAAAQANFLPSSPISPRPLMSIKSSLKATLLIVPPPLIQSWEKQFQIHVYAGSLKICVFHGQSRKNLRLLEDYDVVITTYHTVSSIWRNRHQDRSIFAFMWHRVVLDEAHTIQNAQSQLSEACCSLQSSRRWAITGTPIQNKLTDFASIVKFLQVYPYSKQEIFDEDISKPWRRCDPEGFLRLKTLVRAITISRTKAVINLPARDNFVYHLDFSNDERRLYEDAKTQTVALLCDINFTLNQGSKTFNALERLNTLRLICSHGLLTQTRRANLNLNFSQKNLEASSQVDKTADIEGQLLAGSSVCCNCGADLVEDLLESSPSATYGHWNIPTDRTFSACESCTFQLQTDDMKLWDHADLLSVPGTPPSQSPLPSREEVQSEPLIESSMPTKIKALVNDLIQYCSDEKSVVFSYWTFTLDLIQIMLKNHGIVYTRIDGKTSLGRRTEALRSFEQNASFRVILVSITCGGAGLDLTAASRVYLLEPHWNPMIEEQALCRVHRVGQKRNVTTIRYLMKNSFEEQVVEIQKRKKMLAKVAFGHDPLGENGIGLGTLQYLKFVLE